MFDARSLGAAGRVRTLRTLCSTCASIPPTLLDNCCHSSPVGPSCGSAILSRILDSDSFFFERGSSLRVQASCKSRSNAMPFSAVKLGADSINGAFATAYKPVSKFESASFDSVRHLMTEPTAKQQLWSSQAQWQPLGCSALSAVSAAALAASRSEGNALVALGAGLATGAVSFALCQFCTAALKDDRVRCYNAAHRLIGELDEETFFRLVQSKTVTLHTIKANQGSIEQTVDQSAAVTHAVFFQCEDSTNIYETEKFPFFHQAQIETMKMSYAVPIDMFYRISERLPPRERSPFLLIPSVGRCGSTLLGQLINLHPRITTISEPLHLRALYVLAAEPHASGFRNSTRGACASIAAAGAAMSGIGTIPTTEAGPLLRVSAAIAGGVSACV